MWKSKFAVFMVCVTLVASGLSYNLGRDRGYYEGYGEASYEYQQKQEADKSSSSVAVNSSGESSSVSRPISSSQGSFSRYVEGQNTLKIDYLYTQANVHLRSGPGVEYSSLDLIPSGTLVGVSSYYNYWASVKYKGQSGYISQDYLGENKPLDPNRKTFEELRQEIRENSVEIIESGDDGESETWVWLSATGSKYHSRPDCGNMDPDRARKVSRSEAINEGYSACSNCY